MRDIIDEKILALKNVFLKVWSIESSSKWTIHNPANGQCGVTTLVVNDHGPYNCDIF
ncbi:hypothetical protein J5Y03_08280 [Bacillus sp. RG28]|uniref:Uncharacterized protein n=1 Tax=Gottfriedia endophytica TaxID=2820819 RepID=A0A940NN40_9BACI|nr:hypothetical protein [Gottfriedia endophytica]MBP0725189.1 hypothetical protein [Gottfriedia endophytica]